jgi:exosortase
MEQEEFMSKLSPQLKFCLLAVVSLLLGWRALVATFTLGLKDYEFSYILMILPISLSLIYLEWHTLKPLASPNVPVGAALLAIAVLIAVIGRLQSASLSSDVLLSVDMFALVLSWIGAFVLCFGARMSLSLVFPFCFLFALVPLPQFALHRIVFLLQQGSALAATMLFTAVGVPVSQNGFLITIPGLTVQVAEECSSIRSSSMLLIAAVVLAQLLLRSPWRKALVVALALVLSVAKNGLRIFTIAMLGTRVDPGYLTGRFHHQGGVVFFMIALIGVFLALKVLRHGELSPA